ncbi:uncharacterized protein DS421_3g97070 [Arachis hypogaea]|nr:uncharacterized protein DS421_3g97070 [Arachis hypogaea]
MNEDAVVLSGRIFPLAVSSKKPAAKGCEERALRNLSHGSHTFTTDVTIYMCIFFQYSK